MIERENLEVRRRIRAGIIKYNNYNWVEHLSDYIENINNQSNKKN